jgi:hypothetical protein
MEVGVELIVFRAIPTSASPASREPPPATPQQIPRALSSSVGPNASENPTTLTAHVKIESREETGTYSRIPHVTPHISSAKTPIVPAAPLTPATQHSQATLLPRETPHDVIRPLIERLNHGSQQYPQKSPANQAIHGLPSTAIQQIVSAPQHTAATATVKPDLTLAVSAVQASHDGVVRNPPVPLSHSP